MPREKITAALDIGSNTVLLLVAKCHSDNRIETLGEFVAAPRLAKDIPSTGLLSAQAIKDTVQAGN